MQRKLSIGNIMTATAAAMFILAAITGLHVYAVSNDIAASLVRTDSTYIAKQAINYRNSLITHLVCMLALLSCLFFLMIRTIFNLKAEKRHNQEIIEMQKQKILEQDKLIEKLSELCKNSMERDRVKTEFFSNITHELKTHLSVILGAVQLIHQKYNFSQDLQKNLGKNLNTIMQNSYRLVRLINNILDITRIDSGYAKMNITNCNIIYLVEEITQSVSSYAEQKGLTLEFDTDTEEIITAVDMEKIERVILNLLSNAIKFTQPGGKISVSIYSIGEKVLISVKDTGPGIPKKMQDIIFERFKQVSSDLTRENEGSGIGLSLVKSFVELHHGSVRIESEENKGSNFIIEIPVRKQEDTAENSSLSHKSQNRIMESINIEFSGICPAAS